MGAAAGFGNDGDAGEPHGTDIFMMSGSTLKWGLTSDLTLLNPIEGDDGAGGGSASGDHFKVENDPGVTLALSGANTFSGKTKVTSGTLQFQVGASATTDVTVSGGTLEGNISLLSDSESSGKLTVES